MEVQDPTPAVAVGCRGSNSRIWPPDPLLGALAGTCYHEQERGHNILATKCHWSAVRHSLCKSRRSNLYKEDILNMMTGGRQKRTPTHGQYVVYADRRGAEAHTTTEDGEARSMHL